MSCMWRIGRDIQRSTDRCMSETDQRQIRETCLGWWWRTAGDSCREPKKFDKIDCYRACCIKYYHLEPIKTVGKNSEGWKMSLAKIVGNKNGKSTEYFVSLQKKEEFCVENRNWWWKVDLLRKRSKQKAVALSWSGITVHSKTGNSP